VEKKKGGEKSLSKTKKKPSERKEKKIEKGGPSYTKGFLTGRSSSLGERFAQSTQEKRIFKNSGTGESSNKDDRPRRKKKGGMGKAGISVKGRTLGILHLRTNWGKKTKGQRNT